MYSWIFLNKDDKEMYNNYYIVNQCWENIKKRQKIIIDNYIEGKNIIFFR